MAMTPYENLVSAGYIRIFDDGPRACGADTLEWVPAWYIWCAGSMGEYGMEIWTERRRVR